MTAIANRYKFPWCGIDLELLKKLMNEFTYKPNWTFELLFDESDHPFVVARQWVADSRAEFKPWNLDHIKRRMRYADGRLIDYTGVVSPEEPMLPVSGPFKVYESIETEDDLWRWLRYVVIAEVENHEMDEWFKVRGKLLNDPHKKEERESTSR